MAPGHGFFQGFFHHQCGPDLGWTVRASRVHRFVMPDNLRQITST